MTVPPRRVVSKLDFLRAVARQKRELLTCNPFRLYRYLQVLEHEKFIDFDGRLYLHSLVPPFPGPAFTRTVAASLDFPARLNLAVTPRCHNRCSYCNAAHPPGGEMSGAQLRSVLAQIQDLQVPLINLTGGEALLREDIVDLVAAIDERSAVCLFTTGVGLTAARAAALRDAGLTYLTVSLDHPDAPVNDARRFPGSFATAVAAISTALQAGLFTVVSVVVDRNNLADVERHIGFLNGLGVHALNLLDVIPSGACLTEPPLTEAERARLIAIGKKYSSHPAYPAIFTFAFQEGKERFGCGAGGIQNTYIDTAGNVRPCDYVPVNFGNVLTEPLRAIITRMRTFFPASRDLCFMKRYHREVAERLRGRQVLDYTELTGLLQRAAADPPPRFFTLLHSRDT